MIIQMYLKIKFNFESSFLNDIILYPRRDSNPQSASLEGTYVKFHYTTGAYFVAVTGFEPVLLVSKTRMLNHYTIPLYSQKDSNLQPFP